MPIRKKHHNTKFNRKRRVEHHPMFPYLEQFNTATRIQGMSEHTLRRRDSAIRRFIEWCEQNNLYDVKNITCLELEEYQLSLFEYRKADGQPLAFNSQRVYLSALVAWYKWMTRQGIIYINPTTELLLPRKIKGLPKSILSIDEILQIFDVPNTETPEGLRERTAIELLYSTGMRRAELCSLMLNAIDLNKHTVFINQGKGAKDRYIPVGARAISWIERYIKYARPLLMPDRDTGHLFFEDYGEPYNPQMLGHRAKRFIEMAGINKKGSCHLFRHACATHMLDNGADIRFIQVLLGHSDISSTEIYTRVSIEKLMAVHKRCHPI